MGELQMPSCLSMVLLRHSACSSIPLIWGSCGAFPVPHEVVGGGIGVCGLYMLGI